MTKFLLAISFTLGATATLIVADSNGNQILTQLTTQDNWATVTIDPQTPTDEGELTIDDGTDYLTLEDGVDRIKVSTGVQLVDLAYIQINFNSNRGKMYIDKLGVSQEKTNYYKNIVQEYTSHNEHGETIISSVSAGSPYNDGWTKLKENLTMSKEAFNRFFRV